jgi:serine phosphatase RsbU (regulator of sigma subunit)
MGAAAASSKVRTAGFATAFLGMLDAASGDLVCSSAGHPPGILIARSQPSFLDEGSLLLGGFATATYEDTMLHLDQGDTLLLYTDGLIEARWDGDQFESHLLRELQSLVALPPSQLTQGLYAKALGFSHGLVRDDVALLAVRLQAAPAHQDARSEAVAPD